MQVVGKKKSTHEYSADGALESHGYNCFKKKSAFPEAPPSLWPVGYSEASCKYDRCNELLRGPTPKCGRRAPPLAARPQPMPYRRCGRLPPSPASSLT